MKENFSFCSFIGIVVENIFYLLEVTWLQSACNALIRNYLVWKHVDFTCVPSMADTIMWSNSTFPIAMFGNWKKKMVQIKIHVLNESSTSGCSRLIHVREGEYIFHCQKKLVSKHGANIYCGHLQVKKSKIYESFHWHVVNINFRLTKCLDNIIFQTLLSLYSINQSKITEFVSTLMTVNSYKMNVEYLEFTNKSLQQSGKTTNTHNCVNIWHKEDKQPHIILLT